MRDQLLGLAQCERGTKHLNIGHALKPWQPPAKPLSDRNKPRTMITDNLLSTLTEVLDNVHHRPQ